MYISISIHCLMSVQLVSEGLSGSMAMESLCAIF